MIYNKFEYLWPPRPDNSVLPGLLSFYEKKGWVAQIKKNGACTIWAVSPDKRIITMNRHNEFHKSWTPNRENSEPFMKLPYKWYVFVGEILHLKTPHIKDTLYIFDMLVYDGEYLIGSSFRDRYDSLKELFGPQYIGQTDHSFKINNKVLLAKNFDIGFETLFNKLEDVSDEGLVLKDPNALLEPCIRQGSNNHWLVKCRKRHPNYGF